MNCGGNKIDDIIKTHIDCSLKISAVETLEFVLLSENK